MKSLKSYSLNIPEEDYHNLPAWSYSIIAKYAKNGFSAIATLHDKVTPTPEMEFGSLFDSILTKGKQTLEDYVVLNLEVPEAEKKALNYIAACSTEEFDNLTMEYIHDKCVECEYQKKWKAETHYDHLMPFKDYYNARISGKKIVSKKDWDDAVEMAHIFRNDPYLSKLFGTKNTDKIEYLYQCQFCVNYNLKDGMMVVVKIMPDLTVVNHDEKTIRLVDLKTSSNPAYSFPENFVKMRYDIQASEYTDVMYVVKNGIPEYQDYTILPYLFTDISRTDKVPVTFEYDPKAESQLNGLSFGNESRTYTYKNWETLLTEIISYEESNATVPFGIVTDGANDLLYILNNK